MEVNPSTWVADMLEAHIELDELSATIEGGIVSLVAVHEETGYSIECNYASCDLAKADLLR